jgi:hypothetical protein
MYLIMMVMALVGMTFVVVWEIMSYHLRGRVVWVGNVVMCVCGEKHHESENSLILAGKLFLHLSVVLLLMK